MKHTVEMLVAMSANGKLLMDTGSEARISSQPAWP